MKGIRRIRSRQAVLFVAQAVAAAALLVRPACALDPHKAITQYVQTSWNGESGLPENSVHSITQTSDGYLWLGTEEGLTRFDGVRFVTYTFHNSPGLASDFIQTLAASRDGSLWAGTDSGLSHYHASPTSPRGGKFETLTTKDGLAGDHINALCEDREGDLWVGTGQGLNRIVNGRIENWTSGHGLSDPTVNALVLDAGGTLWVGTDKGLLRFVHGQFVPLPPHSGMPDDGIAALTAAPDGSIWAGTQSHGVAQIRDGHVYVAPTPLPTQEIVDVLADRDGALWIAFDRHGIGRLYHDKLDLYDASRGLPSNLVTNALFEDHEGSIWVGLLDAGVVQLRDGKFSIFGKAEGLAGNYIGEVVQGQDGSMYFGADNYGVNRLFPDGHVEILNQRNGLPNQAVYSLLVTRDGALWIGYRRGTLARYDNGRVSVFHDPQASDASLNSLYEDRDGHIWVGFNPDGLAEFDHGVFRHVTTTGIVRCITQSRDGALWLATDGDGVQRLFHGQITRYTTADGLPSDHSMYVYADGDGDIWVGLASGGLSRIRDGRVVSWTPSQGVPDTAVGSILEDDAGHLWMGGNNGIFRISKQELNQTAGVPGATVHAVMYGQADGLKVAETLFGSMPCAWKGRDGRLWWTTLAGAAVVDPAHMPVNKVVPPVLIEKVVVNGNVVALQDGIRVGTSPANLEVSFTAPSFVAPQFVSFHYRLIGFDPDWITADARNARYTNLPAGHYTFAVEAENDDGMWNRPGASLSFVLKPPLGETPLAYLCYALIGLLLAWAVVAYRTRSLIARHRELERLVAERTSQVESEKSALESARRELHIQATHDSLTGLFNHAAILEHLQREVARAARDGEPLGVILADLDNFKNVNDNYGHLCGDDILRESAARLSAAVRGYDLVGRYGGEEFLILFPGWDFHVAPKRIEDLLDAIRSRPFQIDEGEIRLTCSVGVAMFRPDKDADSVREVLSRADTALYVAKNSGRNTASFEVRPAI